jgi:hypothetical protein
MATAPTLAIRFPLSVDPLYGLKAMGGRDDWTLRAAAWLGAAEATALIVVVLTRSLTRTPLLVAALAVKYVFCVLVTRRSAGAFLGLVFWEVCGLLIALTAPRVALELRLVEVVLALAVTVLLFTSLHLFPTAQLPER